MSQANVEIVRRGIEAVLRRPEPDWATIEELFHSDHEFVPLASLFEGGSHRGTRGYRDWLLKTQDFLEWETRVEQVTEIDTDRVLAITPIKVRGRSSGVALREQRVASIVALRAGQIVRSELYPSPEEALEAAGLEG
jgi:ketosteroid isomerase-like protein